MTDMLTRREIAAGEWAEFCREFGLQHQGWITTVAEVESARLRAGGPDRHGESRLTIENAVLRSLLLEEKNDAKSVVVLMESGSKPLVQRVKDPVKIFFEETTEGATRDCASTGRAGYRPS